MNRRKRSKAEKECELLRSLLYDVTTAAERVEWNYGHEDDDSPIDGNAWNALRLAIREVRSKGDIGRLEP